jgi:hypothetical protein
MTETQAHGTDTDIDTDTDTETPPPPPIFTADEPVADLWVRAYQGEILGEILFARVADHLDDPDHARKMRVLSTMERRTKEAMVPSLERAGLPTGLSPDTVQIAESLADGLADVSWTDFMASFAPITAQYSAMYVRIGELDPSERATADLLVAHEAALQEFGRREIAGNGEDSLTMVLALPHMH